jgi:RinA family phage transcriptional activator
LHQPIPRNVYKFIEYELYDYRLNRKKLDEIKNDYYNSSPAGDGTGIRGNQQASTTESKVLQIMTDREVQRLERTVRAIEDVLATLGEMEKQLLELKYFRNTHTNQGVKLELQIPSDSTYYALKNSLVRKFAVRYGFL